jgi:hypothetical protein
LNPGSNPILEAHMNLKELKAIIEVEEKPKRIFFFFFNQSLFEGKNQSSPMLQTHMTLRRLKVT